MLRLSYKSRCVGELRTVPSILIDFEYANSIIAAGGVEQRLHELKILLYPYKRIEEK